MTSTKYTPKGDARLSAESMGQDSHQETVLHAAILVSDLHSPENVCGPQQDYGPDLTVHGIDAIPKSPGNPCMAAHGLPSINC